MNTYQEFFHQLFITIINFLKSMEYAFQWLSLPLKDFFKSGFVPEFPSNPLYIMQWFVTNLLSILMDTLMRMMFTIMQWFGIDISNYSVITVLFTSTAFFALLGWGLLRSIIN